MPEIICRLNAEHEKVAALAVRRRRASEGKYSADFAMTLYRQQRRIAKYKAEIGL